MCGWLTNWLIISLNNRVSERLYGWVKVIDSVSDYTDWRTGCVTEWVTVCLCVFLSVYLFHCLSIGFTSCLVTFSGFTTICFLNNVQQCSLSYGERWCWGSWCLIHVSLIFLLGYWAEEEDSLDRNNAPDHCWLGAAKTEELCTLCPPVCQRYRFSFRHIPGDEDISPPPEVVEVRRRSSQPSESNPKLKGIYGFPLSWRSPAAHTRQN